MSYFVEKPAGISRHNLVTKLQKGKLLVAINAIASLSIFFFGYDQ